MNIFTYERINILFKRYFDSIKFCWACIYWKMVIRFCLFWKMSAHNSIIRCFRGHIIIMHVYSIVFILYRVLTLSLNLIEEKE